MDSICANLAASYSTATSRAWSDGLGELCRTRETASKKGFLCFFRAESLSVRGVFCCMSRTMSLSRSLKEKKDKGGKDKESKDSLHQWNVYRVSKMDTNRNRMNSTHSI
jgi:hypothetical protein